MYCIAHTRLAVSCPQIVTRDNLQITNSRDDNHGFLEWWNTQNCIVYLHIYMLLSELNFLSGAAAYQHPTFGSLNNETEKLFN